MTKGYRALPQAVWDQLQFALSELEHFRREYPGYRPQVFCYPDHGGRCPYMLQPKRIRSRYEQRLVWYDPNLPSEDVVIEGANRVAEVSKILDDDIEADRQLASVCREIEPLLRQANVSMTPGDEGSPEGRVTWWAICIVNGRDLSPSNSVNMAIDDHFTTILKALRMLKPLAPLTVTPTPNNLEPAVERRIIADALRHAAKVLEEFAAHLPDPDNAAAQQTPLDVLDQAGRQVIRASKAGYLALEGLTEWVAWSESPTPEPMNGRAERLRCPTNLFIEVCGLHEVKAFNHGNGTLTIDPVLTGGILPRLYPDIFPPDSLPAQMEMAPPEQRQQYQVEIEKRKHRHRAKCCGFLAAMIEGKEASEKPPQAADGPSAPDVFHWKQKPVQLAPKPWAVVSFLWNLPNRTATKNDVCVAVWDDEEAGEHALRGAIHRANDSFLKAAVPLQIKQANRQVVLEILDKT